MTPDPSFTEETIQDEDLESDKLQSKKMTKANEDSRAIDNGVGLPFDDDDLLPGRRGSNENGQILPIVSIDAGSHGGTMVENEQLSEDIAPSNIQMQQNQNILPSEPPSASPSPPPPPPPENISATVSSSSVPSAPSESEYAAPSTPPPSDDILGEIIMREDVRVSDDDEDEESSSKSQSQQSLESRVHELEAKLATLSLLLQQQRIQSLRPLSPVTTPIRKPQAQSPCDKVARATPALDSPAPPSHRKESLHKRNLSFKLLYQEGDGHQKASFLESLASAADSGHTSPVDSRSVSPPVLISGQASSQIPSNSEPFDTNHDYNLDYDAKKVERRRYRAKSFDVVRASTRRVSEDNERSRTNGQFELNPKEAKRKSTSTMPPECFLPTEGMRLRKQMTPSKIRSDSVSVKGEEKDTEVSKTESFVASEKILKSESAVSNASTNEGKEKNSSESNPKSNFLNYLNSYQESTHDVDAQMEEFIKVPGAVEALLSYGYWVCVDAFLYVLTILPIRFVWSCLLLVRYVILWCKTGAQTVPEGPYRFHRRHSYQFIQVGIICAVYKYVLMPISIGKLYHWIRGQNMIKLYMLIAIVEVFDRLMCSLGQDCLDSLYWNTTRRPKSSRLVISIIVVLVYATLHSCLLFVHVATLNVAMNSADQALLTMLIGGNFAEIKSTVFKKYNKPNLFKITASDICERFKLALFLCLVLMLNAAQGMDQAMVYSYVQMCCIVWCAEWLADWIKHAFITKLNFIDSKVYYEYGLLLAGDVTGIGHEGVNLDHTHAIVKRIGLAQIPLVCVMARYVREAFKYYTLNNMSEDDEDGDESTTINRGKSVTYSWMIQVLGVWLALLVVKVSLGRILHKLSKARLKAAPGLLRDVKANTKKKKE